MISYWLKVTFVLFLTFPALGAPQELFTSKFERAALVVCTETNCVKCTTNIMTMLGQKTGRLQYLDSFREVLNLPVLQEGLVDLFRITLVLPKLVLPVKERIDLVRTWRGVHSFILVRESNRLSVCDAFD